MKATRQLLIIVILLLISACTTSCDTNRLKVEKYFQDYTYDTSLEKLKANKDRFTPNYIGYNIKGRSRYLGYPLDVAMVMANQRSGGFKGLSLKMMPNTPLDKVIQKLTKEYGEPSLALQDSYIWDMGSSCLLLDTSELNNGVTINIYHHKSAFQPFNGFQWDTDRGTIEQQIGKPNLASEDEADHAYQIEDVYEGHDANIKYLFTDNKLTAVECKLSKQKSDSKPFINYDTVPNKAVKEIHATLVDVYGEEDNKSNYSGILVLEWNFGTSKIFYYESEGYLGGNTLSLTFQKSDR